MEVMPKKRIAGGDSSNVSELRIGTHTGTHIDPPVHFIEGAAGIDRVPLDRLVGDAIVADLSDKGAPLGPEDLDGLGLPRDAKRLLLRTANSLLWRSVPVRFPDTYACLTPRAAEWVVERGIELIGVDFLSVEQGGAPGHPVHHILLENDVLIVEGLNLLDVEPGTYMFVCLPLKIVEGDGGPARAALIER